MFIAGESGLPLEVLVKAKPAKPLDDRILLFSHARGAMQFFLQATDIDNKKRNVLVPAYLCDDYVKSIPASGFNLKFYQIDHGFNPVAEDLFEKIDSKTFAVVIVHYFGFLYRHVDRVIDYCRQRNVSVIEDYAHFLYCDDIRKSIKGDIAIFSLWKLLSIPDGGLLYDNTASVVQNVRSLSKTSRYSQKIYRNTAKLVLKYYMQKIRFVPAKKYSPIDNSQADKTYSGIRRISNLSESVFRKTYQTGYVAYIRGRRRENFLRSVSALNSHKKALPFSLPFTALSDDDIPYIFPVMFTRTIYSLVDKLRQKGLPFITWPGLDKNLTSYAGAEKIRSKLLFLPLHESLQTKHILHMAETLKGEVCS
ncbi:MAG: hypothetical protein AMJ43_08035 [Coxiella sp. DG_40]|nr:MAG: hypothetical protein AMJ43_08035 [Coxiella sp. DG_40]